jgi:tetratricopeptide (TPR) repeat protein
MTMSLGRNDPCHCGSGEKYKKCHLEADQAARDAADLKSARTADAIDVPDRRAMEGMLAGIGRAFGGRQRGKRSALDDAQDVMYGAWEARTVERRISLAREALAISDDCADAYVLLAQESTRSEQDAKALYEKGVAAGERALGPQAFKDDAGHFWGLLETRPYMRARHGLAQCLWHSGDRDAAIQHFSEMLRLNPNDNQGVRYELAACLLEAGRDENLASLLDQYKDDGTAFWVYAKALLAFRQRGDVAASRKLLTAAVKTNPHVPGFLLGRKKLPRRLPD